MSKPTERRCFQVEELRVESKDDRPVIRGYAAVFNSLSENLRGFREIVKPGAFTKTIEDGSDVRALWNHDVNYVLGRTKSNTLRLEQDSRGLRVEIDPPDTQWAKDHIESIRRGDVSQMSFGFRVMKDSWSRADPESEDRKIPIRELIEVSLFDVSPVTYPAYPETTVDIRSTLREKGIDPDKFEEILNSSLQESSFCAIVAEIRKLTSCQKDEEQPESCDHHSDNEPESSDHHSSEPSQQRPRLLRVRLGLADRQF